MDPVCIEAVAEILEPFKEATAIMSTETSSSISLIRPLMLELMTSCRQLTIGEDVPASIREMGETIRNDLETR